ncbi:hypothetical protein JCM5353_003192 [Sporobolomyces roseus]
MTSRRSGLSWLVVILAIPFVKALVVITPDNETVWDRTGNTKTYIKWGLDPPTDPPPRTNLFTIWLRNGAPDMYDPPLNLTLARHVDFVGKSQVEVQDVIDFLAGPGYQLFLSDPDNSTIVYCESPVFDIEDDPEVALERRRRRAAGETFLSSSDAAPAPTRDPEEPSTTSIAEETSTSSLEEEATSEAEEPTRVITQDAEPAPTDPPREEEPIGSIEDAASSSWWSSSISSMFSSTTTEEPAPAEDTRREPILRPSPPPIRNEEPPASSEPPPPPPPSSTSTIGESPPTSTSITPPPPVSSSEASPSLPPPPPSATIVEPSPAGSSSRDFYWYYSVSESPAPEPTPSSSPQQAAPSNVATINANAPCTCGQNQAVSNVEAGTTFQILIRPMPGSHADEGLRLITAGATSLSSVGMKGLLSVLAGSLVVLFLF